MKRRRILNKNRTQPHSHSMTPTPRTAHTVLQGVGIGWCALKLEYPTVCVCVCVCVCVPRVLVSQILVDLCVGVQWSGHKRVDGEAQSHARHTKTPSRVAVGFPAQWRAKE